MDKWRFKDILKKEGYKVAEDASYPTVIVPKNDIRMTYAKIKLIANKVGYKHTFGVKAGIETKVVDWPEEETSGQEV